MKQFHKLLALVLAAVMMLSLVPIVSAANVKYTDARTITRTAAVDVLSSLGVIGGYSNGTFRPSGSITRAEISKILAVMLNGGEDPGDQYGDACTFADCKGHWAVGYIGYCVANGLVGGRNPQTFDPEGKVTVAEAAKMLLCALGYDAKYRIYFGTNWKSNVGADAAKAGLFENLLKLKNDDDLNREDACQMMLNAMESDMVYFPDIQAMTFGDVTYTQNSEPKPVPIAVGGIDFDYQDRVLDEGTPGGIVQLCEKLFKNLRKDTVGHNEIGAPATTWHNNSTVLGPYNDSKPLVTGDTGISGKTVRGRLSSDPKAVRFFQNGLLANEYSIDDLRADQGWAKSEADTISSGKNGSGAQFYGNLPTGSGSTSQITQSASMLLEVWRKSNTSLRRIIKATGNLTSGTAVSASGIHVETYYDEKDPDRVLTITAQPYYPGQIVSAIPPVLDDAGDVVRDGYLGIRLDATPSQWYDGNAVAFQGCEPLDLGDGYTVHSTSSGVVYASMSAFADEDPADLVVGKYVTLAFSHDPSNANGDAFIVDRGIVLQELTSTLAQKITTSVGDTKYLSQTTFDGINYNRSSMCQGYNFYNDVEIGTAYTIRYCTFDSSNVVFHFIDAVGDVNTSYAYVRSAGAPTDSLSDHAGAARLLFADGSEKVVYTAANQWDTAGYIVRFTYNKKTDEYTLTPVGVPSTNVPFSETVTVNKGKANMTFGGANVTANDQTIYIIGTRNTTTNELEFATYTGIKKTPSVTAAKYFAYYAEDNIAKLVFLEDATLGDDNTGIYGVLVKTAKDPAKTADFGTYYQVKAIVSGEIKTLDLSEDEYNALGGEGLKIFKNLRYDNNNLVSGHTAIVGTQINTMTTAEKGIVTFNGNTSLSYHENVLVYIYHAASGTMEISEPELLLPIGDPQYADQYAGAYPSFYTLNPEYDYPVLAAIYVCMGD